MRTNTFQDKSDWGDGPWQDEFDYAHWIDEDTDLDCLIVRNHFGTLCGYVGVPPEHRFFGKDCDEIEADVHGGLTFSGLCNENAPEGEGICHVPLPGRSETIHWLGFDTGHFMDIQPGMLARERKLFEQTGDSVGLPFAGKYGETYKTVEYVKDEIKQLAAQLV